MNERELDKAPSMLPLLARAGAGMIPGASRLPFLSGGAGEIPDLQLSLRDVGIDRDRLSAYQRICGFPVGDRVPVTYPHMLAFPLALSLMTDSSFPFSAIGLVHITNSITQHRPVGVDEKLSIRVWATKLEPHRRGQQFSIRSQARVGAELVWEEVSSNLRRGGGGSSDRPDRTDRTDRAAAGERASADPQLPTETWSLPGDLGRRYGSVSGDLNPIHMHPLSARLFGFPSAIAHGMWTKARCLAALENQLPDAYSVEVAFHKPILLPAKVKFSQAASERETRFSVRDAAKGTSHLNGALSFC